MIIRYQARGRVCGPVATFVLERIKVARFAERFGWSARIDTVKKREKWHALGESNPSFQNENLAS